MLILSNKHRKAAHVDGWTDMEMFGLQICYCVILSAFPPYEGQLCFFFVF